MKDVICDCGEVVSAMRWDKALKSWVCEACVTPEPIKLGVRIIVKGNNRTNKKMSAITERYIKSRYIGPDGKVKCDPRFKPSEHYLGD